MGPSARLLAAALCFLPALLAAEFTTYIGDIDDYHVARVAADSAGNTNTNDLPTTPGAFLTKGPGAFVAKVNAAGSALAYLTYISPANFIYAPSANPANIAAAIAVDAAGTAVV
jgi:hypothetical protein